MTLTGTYALEVTHQGGVQLRMQRFGFHVHQTNVLRAAILLGRSPLATMLFAQLSHVISLNDVCDWLRLKAAALSRLHLSPPSRNALSYANKVRSADFIETLFWSVLEHLQNIQPAFAKGKKGKGLLRRFKVRMHAVDSTVMELVATCIGWAKHRRRNAAAKMHLRLDLRSFPPLLPLSIPLPSTITRGPAKSA